MEVQHLQALYPLHECGNVALAKLWLLCVMHSCTKVSQAAQASMTHPKGALLKAVRHGI